MKPQPYRPMFQRPKDWRGVANHAAWCPKVFFDIALAATTVFWL